MKTHKELHDEWMKDPEYQVAYEEEIRTEKLQAMLKAWRESAGLTKV